jgi:protein-L-isoaspartate(D-aspartate) O-methyltransferase
VNGEAATLRAALLERMRASGVVRSERIAQAFAAEPRERYVAGALHDVYDDRAIVIKRDGEFAISSSSQPSMMALMLEQLALEPGMRVLEIGTGSGYNAALLARLAGPQGSVVTLDLEADLVRDAAAALADVPTVEVLLADADAPGVLAGTFDRIIATGAASEVSPEWFAALRPGGRIVLPLVLGTLQVSVAFERAGVALESVSCVGASFMSLRGVARHAVRATLLGDEPAIVLRARDEGVAPEAVWALLSTGGTPESEPLGCGEAQHDFGLWLDVREPAFCALNAGGDAARARRVPDAYGEEAGCAEAFVATYGLFAEGSLALVERTPSGPGLRSYGSPAAARRLRAAAAAWREAGSPGADQLHIRALYGEPEPPPAGAIVLERPRSRLQLAWDAPGTGAWGLRL